MATKITSNSKPGSPKVAISTNLETLADNGVAILTFTFSSTVMGFSLDDIKVTNGTVTNLVQSSVNPNVFTANFFGGINETSRMSTIKVDGVYADASGKEGTPSNTVTIKNLDSVVTPTVAFTSNNASITEGNSGTTPFNFTVQLSSAVTEPVTVYYTTEKNMGGTAKANTDYVPVTSSVTFAPGETSKTVSVNVIGDTVYEANEYFYLNLSSAQGANIVTNGAEGYRNSWVMATIKNDDLPGSTQFGILGTPDKDTLGGKSGDDYIDGKGGMDILTGYAGSDTFVFAKSYAAKTVDTASKVMDFGHGIDHIGLQGDLTFSEVTLRQGTGTHASDTIVSLSSGDVLVVLVGVNAATLSTSDFTHIA